MKIKKTTKGLRDALFKEIELLQSGTVNQQRSIAVSKLSSQILTSIRLELDYQRFVKSTNDTKRLS